MGAASFRHEEPAESVKVARGGCHGAYPSELSVDLIVEL